MVKFYVAVHALIGHNGKYLATRRSSLNDYMPLKWDIPGGYVEPGETMEQALVRELNCLLFGIKNAPMQCAMYWGGR